MRKLAPLSPAGDGVDGEDADSEATKRSTCSCRSGGNLSTCFAISCLTSIRSIFLCFQHTLRESSSSLVAGHYRSTGLISGYGTVLGGRECEQGYADDDQGQNTPQFSM